MKATSRLMVTAITNNWCGVVLNVLKMLRSDDLYLFSFRNLGGDTIIEGK